MPPGRRKGTQQTRHAQPTLSFHSKPTKVTKPITTDPLTKKSSKAEPALVEAITDNSPISEVALKQQIKAEAAKPKDEAALQAQKVTDLQIKKYWEKEEDVRKAPRGLTVNAMLIGEYMLTAYNYSPSTRSHCPRENTPTLRPLLAVWALHWHSSDEAMEESEYTGSQSAS